MIRTARSPHYWTTFALLAVAVTAFSLMQSMTIPVLPRIAIEHDTDQATVAWVLTAYLLAAAICTPILGRLGDAYGKERMLIVSLGMLAIGSLISAIAPSIGVLIAARAITGAGGGVMPLAFGIIRDEFPSAKMSNAISCLSALSAFGLGVGIVLAGPVVDWLGYAWLFWLPFIVATAAAVGTHFVIPPSPVRSAGRVPVAPALMLSVWLTALLLALSRAPQWGWISARVLILLTIAAITATWWIKLELRVKVPLIDMRMMRLPGVWTTNLVALLVGIAMYASLGFIPQLLQTPTDSGYGVGATVTESGFYTVPNAIFSFLIGFVVAPIARRIGAKTLVVIGCLFPAAAMFVLAFAHSEPWHFLLATSLGGIGFGVLFACLATLIVAAVPPAQTGVASGMNSNIRMIGGSLGTAVMASIVTAGLTSGGIPEESRYTIGFALLGVAMIGAAIAALAIPRAAKVPAHVG